MIVAGAPSLFAALETEVFDLAKAVRPSIVAVRDGGDRGGAGVVWETGLVVSNHHVVASDTCRIVFATGQRVDARVVARDSENDLVSLAFDPIDGFTPSPIARRADPLRAGELVIAVGHPVGVEWALTVGILSALPRPDARRQLVRASITLQPGNSGGPLLDASGALIGVNAMLTGPAEALAIPVTVVADVIRRAAITSTHEVVPGA
jgi:serine protease Do